MGGGLVEGREDGRTTFGGLVVMDERHQTGGAIRQENTGLQGAAQPCFPSAPKDAAHVVCTVMRKREQHTVS